jgi:regulator of protease activity HflC (stomatin/prohibitin superfamily)
MEWIVNFLDAIISVFPRLVKVRDIETIVIWDWRGRMRAAGPGLHIVWPLVASYEIVDMRWRTAITFVQTVTLADGASVSARTMLLWRPRDAFAMVAQSTDGEERTAEVSQTMVTQVLHQQQTAGLRELAGLNTQLTELAKAELNQCGIEIKYCRFTELTLSRAYRLINDHGSE